MRLKQAVLILFCVILLSAGCRGEYQKDPNFTSKPTIPSSVGGTPEQTTVFTPSAAETTNEHLKTNSPSETGKTQEDDFSKNY